MSDDNTIVAACISCGEKLKSSATLCHHCKSYQRSWKNSLLYYSQISALISLVSVSVFFAFTHFPVQPEPQVIAFKSGDYIVIMNQDDDPIYASHIDFEIDLFSYKQKSSSQRLDITIPARDVIRMDFPADTNEKWSYVGATSTFDTAKQRASEDQENECFKEIATTDKDSSLELVRQSYLKKGYTFPTLPAKGTLIYYASPLINLPSLNAKIERRVTLNLVGQILFKDVEKCTSTDWFPSRE
ncbi:MAG: hypothetical protein AAB581_02405 [Patescibacteria group bacterium]